MGLVFTSASNAVPPWGCYNNVNELPKHIKWGGKGISSHMKSRANIGLHCTSMKLFPNNDHKKGLHSSLLNKLFRGLFCKLRRNWQTLQRIRIYFPLFTANLLLPPSTQEKGLLEKKWNIKYRYISTQRLQYWQEDENSMKHTWYILFHILYQLYHTNDQQLIINVWVTLSSLTIGLLMAISLLTAMCLHSHIKVCSTEENMPYIDWIHWV